MMRQWLSKLALGLGGLLLTHSVFAITPAEIDLIRKQQVIELKGVDLPMLLGKSANQMSVLAYQNGKLESVPYQFDDIDEKGAVFMSQGKEKLRGRLDIFEAHDSLLLMYKDGGTRMPSDMQEGSRVISEIRIGEANNDKFFYVMEGPGVRSTKQYVKFDANTGFVETEYYSVQTDPTNFLMWTNFSYKGYQDKSKTTLLDSLKVRMSAGLLANAAQITLDNRNVETRVVQVHQGAIRSTVLVDANLKVLGVPIITVDLHMDLLPKSEDIRANVHVPAIIASLLRDPSLSISLDGNDLRGSVVRTALGPKDYAVVDGKTSDIEKEISKHGVDNQNTWVWLSTGKNFDIIADMKVPANFTAPVSVLYEDDEKLVDTPEVFPGQLPNVGYKVSKIPINDTFPFRFILQFSDDMGRLDPDVFAQVVKSQPPMVATQPNSFKQFAGQPRAIIN